MKTIVVGDLHGKYEIAEKALSKGFPVVFVGDYLDSFDRDIEDQFKCLNIVLDACRKGKAQALYGNHELSYLVPSMQCSGFNRGTFLFIQDVDLSPLQNYIWVDDVLITHAGLSQAVLDDFDNVDAEDYLGLCIENLYYQDIGYARGGSKPCGSIFWCDWDAEFVPIDGVKQVFGHTRGKDVRQKEDSFCIDCLDTVEKVAVIEDGNISIVNLEEI
jgi:hypothetical protein